MTTSATIDAQPDACPKCSGTLIKDFDGDHECLQCGCVVYARPPIPVDPTKRERLPTFQGIKI